MEPELAMDEETFTFTWQVKNFSFCADRIGQPFTSERIVTGTLHDPTYMAFFHPRVRADPEFISLLMSRVDLIPVEMEVRVIFQLVAPDGTPGNRVHLTEKVPMGGTFWVTKFASRRVLEERYLHNDTLTMQCVFRKNKELAIQTLFARTTNNVRKICKVWTLENFSQRNYRVQKSVLLLDGSTLLVNVCLSIEGIPGLEVVVIKFTRFCDIPGKPLSLNTLITVLDAQEMESEVWKQEHHVFHMQSVWQFPTFITKARLLRQKNMYLTNDVLALKCEFAVTSGAMTSQIERIGHYLETDNTKSFHQLTEDLKDLYNSKRFADVKLRVSGETVPAHKVVLQSRSEKFAKMLDDLEGMDNDVLHVPDVDVITLKRMLKYMYTDEIDDLDYEDVVVAYSAAHKYRIESLKCKYSFLLQFYLNGSNVDAIFMLASDSFDQYLENCAKDFIEKYRSLDSNGRFV